MEQPTPEYPKPEYKDWTWVLEQTCAECGFDASTIEPADVPARLRASAATFRTLLGRGDIVHERPPVPAGASPVWSALEYGAHVRDVYEIASERLTKMLKKKGPRFPDWDQNEAAISGDYANADVDKVRYDLAANLGRFADLLDKVRGDQWERTGTRSDDAEFTIATFATYMLHDVVHHVADVERGYEAIIEARKKSK